MWESWAQSYSEAHQLIRFKWDGESYYSHSAPLGTLPITFTSPRVTKGEENIKPEDVTWWRKPWWNDVNAMSANFLRAYLAASKSLIASDLGAVLPILQLSPNMAKLSQIDSMLEKASLCLFTSFNLSADEWPQFPSSLIIDSSTPF